MPISMLTTGGGGEGEPPAELEGYGPITAVAARAIAAGGTLRRLLTDPTSGRLLEYGHTRYQPPQHLAEHVITRDRTCRFPTCNWRAQACDIDHTLAYQQGGPTGAGNLEPLHRGHHNGKTHHGWRLLQPEPGQFAWISPTGHIYHVAPESIGAIARAAVGEHDPPQDPAPIHNRAPF